MTSLNIIMAFIALIAVGLSVLGGVLVQKNKRLDEAAQREFQRLREEMVAEAEASVNANAAIDSLTAALAANEIAWDANTVGAGARSAIEANLAAMRAVMESIESAHKLSAVASGPPRTVFTTSMPSTIPPRRR